MKKLIILLLSLFLLMACNTKEENTMNYIKFGNGSKTFIIIPGLSIHSIINSKDAIEEAFKDYTDDYTVYVFDRPENLKENTTIKDLADATANKMKELNISSADIFGASQGGMMAMYIAIYYPELVNKLVLGSTLSKTNDTFINVVNNWIDLAKEKNEDELLDSFIKDVYSQNTYDNYKDSLIEANKNISDEEYNRFIILANACLSTNCYDELDKIKCPVLVLGCYGDKVVTPLGSTQIADKLNCDIYMYDDSYGHGVYDEAPDYREKMLDFLRQ